MVRVPSPPASLAARSLRAGLFFFAAIQIFVIGLSLIGVTFDRTVALAVTLAAVVSGAIGARGGGPSRISEAQSRSTQWLAVPLGLWAITVWLRCVWIAARRPVYDWDGLYYHIPALQGWVAYGRVQWLEGFTDIPFANGYPMGLEVWSFWLHFLTGSSRWVDATNLWLWPLGALGLWVSAEEWGASRAGRGLAACGWALAPAFVVLAATSYADPAFACAASVLMASSLRWVRLGPDAAWIDRIAVGLAAGLVLATKGSGLAFAFVLIAVAALVWLRRHGRGRELGRTLALIGLLTLLTGGYWMLRNLVHTGNPLHPIAFSWIGAAGYDPSAMVDLNLPTWLRAWPGPLRMVRAWIPPLQPVENLNSVQGLGAVWAFAALPALIVAAFARRHIAGTPRWSLAAAVGILLFQPGAWWARLTLWLLAWGMPALGRFAPSFRTPWTWGLVLVLASGVYESERALLAQRQLGQGPDGEYVATINRFFPGLSDAPRWEPFFESPHIARGPWSRLGTLLGGTLALPLDQRRIDVVGPQPTAEQIATLKDSGVEWILWDRCGAGEVPATLNDASVEDRSFRTGEDVDLVALRLR